MRLLTLLAVALSMALPASAATAITQLQVDTRADHVKLTIQGNAPLDPSLRMDGDQRFLELKFSPAVLKSGRRQVMAVDKGLIRRVELDSSGKNVLVRVYVVSKPKTNLVKSDGGKTITYTVSTVEMAQTPTRTASAAPAPRPAAPAPKPPAPVPSAPAAGTRPPVAPAPAAPAPAAPAAQVPERTISFTAMNSSLPEALRSMAAEAGLTAEVHPSVQGYVNASFMDIPLKVALDSVLNQQTSRYRYDVVGTTLRVYPEGSTPVAAPRPTSSRVARDYFPFKDRKASEMLEAARTAVPHLTYFADDRLNVLMAEGDPADLERLHRLLSSLSQK